MGRATRRTSSRMRPRSGSGRWSRSRKTSHTRGQSESHFSRTSHRVRPMVPPFPSPSTRAHLAARQKCQINRACAHLRDAFVQRLCKQNHHWLVAQQPPVSELEARSADITFARRWECLLSYDDLVGKVVDEVEALGELDNTYFFMTSDHGFHFHELRMGVGKWSVYETDVRVPMLVVGPGVEQNATLEGVVGSHIDLAPTWMELAGVERPEWMDGRSVAPRLLGDETEAGDEEQFGRTMLPTSSTMASAQ